MASGADIVVETGNVLMNLLNRSFELSELMFSGGAINAPMAGMLSSVARAVFPLFFVPATVVLVAILAQRAFVVTPSKLQLKLSRISIIKNAKNKFGRSGLVEFFKSFVKLVIYSVCLGVFLNAYMSDIVAVTRGEARSALGLMVELAMVFLFIVVCVSGTIGAIDAIWQHQEHLRKNRMSRKEIMDENKESEGDPYMKQERRSRAHAIAAAQMISEVPDADVVIVNPTHYAVALKWSRLPGSAPMCVAKGVDSLALRIREVAQENAVPIHSDPPTARALHATTEIGAQIEPEYYQAVAAAIRFADEMRVRAGGQA